MGKGRERRGTGRGKGGRKKGKEGGGTERVAEKTPALRAKMHRKREPWLYSLEKAERGGGRRGGEKGRRTGFPYLR